MAMSALPARPRTKRAPRHISRRWLADPDLDSPPALPAGGEVGPKAGRARLGAARGRHAAIDVAQRAPCRVGRPQVSAVLARYQIELAGMKDLEAGPMADAHDRGLGQLLDQELHDGLLSRLVERRCRLVHED